MGTITVLILTLSSAASGQVFSSWSSIINTDGNCVTGAGADEHDERLVGDIAPTVYILRLPDQPNLFVVEIAAPVEQSQIFVEIDGVVYPTGTLDSGTQAVLIARSPDASGHVVFNEPANMRVANKAIVLAMSRGNKLTVHVVVRDGPKIGTVYDDVYSLEGFAEAKAASDAACN